jgi:putative transposase
LADLGVTKTHSRPHVSNDNPFSEAQLKTLKCRPGLPGRFGSLDDARAHVGPFMDGYNDDHHHSGVALLTPSDVHHGRARQRHRDRHVVLTAAHRTRPERSVRGPPTLQDPPAAVWFNKPTRSVPALPASASAETESQGNQGT